MITFRKALEDRAKKSPDDIFVLFENQAISNKSVNDSVNRIANGLMDLEVKKGDNVALFMPNRPEFIYAYLANAKIGAANVIISPNYTAREVLFFLNHSEANTIFTNRKLLELILEIKKDCLNLKNIICIDSKDLDPNLISFDDLIEKSPNDAPAVDVVGDDIAGIQYTSGTSSGTPKGVLYSNDSFGFSAKEWYKICQVTDESRIITVSQFVHANGVLAMLMALLSGASFVITEEFSASKFWGLVDQWKPTHFVTVAAFLSILMTLPRSKEEEENSLNVIFSVAASKMYHKITERLNVELLDCFAMSETAGTMTPIPIDKKYKVGSAGYPHAGVDLRIFDDDGNEMPPGIPGEIVIKNPTMFKGYYKNPKATEEAMRGGWFHTGDLAYLDNDGCLWFVDRKKDIVRRAGENISSLEVEGVLCSCPGISEAAIVGIPDEVLGEEVKAFIVKENKDDQLNEEETVNYCRERLAKFKVPRYFEYVDSFPKTPSGKIKKVELKQ